MNKKIVIPTVLISTLIICFFVSIGFRMLASSTKCCREGSAWGALDQSIHFEIDDYYKKHNKYPDSLEALNLKFSDGATPDMLNQIQYKSDGTSCKYSYYRHAGKWDTNIKTRVEIIFSEGKSPEEHTATTP